MAINPRYEAYAAAHGMTIPEMFEYWDAIRNGDKRYDRTVEFYSIWLTSQIIAWMEQTGRQKFHGWTEHESRGWHLCTHEGIKSFNAWLKERWGKVESHAYSGA